MDCRLCCEFLVPSTKDAGYWWPLIFEAMSEQSVHFSVPDPDFIQGTGHYSYIRLDDPSNSDVVTGSFRMLWDEIYSQESRVLVILWFADADPFSIQVSLEQRQEEQQIQICMDIACADLRELPPKAVQRRLRRILEAAGTLSTMCQPCTGEVYWSYAGEQYAPWASFSKFPPTPSAERRFIAEPKRELLRYVFPASGQYVHLLNPVPIPKRGGSWEFISLVE